MKCPCEECISFAICNMKIKESVGQHSVMRECCDLQEYLGLNRQFRRRSYRDQINFARKLFGLPPVECVW